MHPSAGDAQRTAIDHARALAPAGVVTTHLDGLLACAPVWSRGRLVDEALDLARDMTGAERALLFRESDGMMRCTGCRPQHLDSGLVGDEALDRFPWDMPQLRPRRFLLIDTAARVRLADGRTLGDFGVASVLHLPLAGPDGERGALHLHWEHTVDRWDDRVGALLRAVGAFVLHQVAERGAAPDSTRASEVAPLIRRWHA